MIQHRVERLRDRLRVTLDLEFAEVVAGLQPESGYRERVEAYCQNHVIPDVLDVAERLADEDTTGGVVKWFDDSRGYGFIRRYDGRDVFVHFSDITSSDGYRTLRQGQRVRFKCREGRERLSALDVTPVGEPSE